MENFSAKTKRLPGKSEHLVTLGDTEVIKTDALGKDWV
jgi:hypothetical protein